jgi:predicted RNA-binding protein associated with RNAse of E/G family
MSPTGSVTCRHAIPGKETHMNAISKISSSERYARCVETSKRVRWDIEEDVIRGRRFDAVHKFLPDGLSLADGFTTLSAGEKRFASQIQGRTYANVFGLVERFINAKVLELSHDHWFGDQVALEALVRFSDEELKHQALFRRIDEMVGDVLPQGYHFDVDPNAVAHAVLGKSTWAVLALTLDIELFTQLHYRQSIEPDAGLSELFKDVFLYHWREESQHAILDELEWVRHDAQLTEEQRDRAVDEFIELVAAVDGILQAQAKADAGYFAAKCGRAVDESEAQAIETTFLKAYRWQYIHSGAQHPHFGKVLSSLITKRQGERIQSALATLQ